MIFNSTQPKPLAETVLAECVGPLSHNLSEQPSIQQQLHGLQSYLRDAQNAWQQDKAHQTQYALEQALLGMIQTMQSLEINPNDALQRAWYRQQLSDRDNEAIIYADRIAFYAQGELRCEWPIHSLEDYHHYLALAKDLGCSVTHVDNKQLALF